MAMGSSSPRRATALLLAVIAVFVAAAGGARPGGGGVVVDTVADSCNAISDFVEVGFCEAALRSSPGAASADRHGHLLIAADLAVARGSSARDAVAELARGERDAGARDGLEACGLLYGASVPALQFMRGYAAARSWEAARSLLWLSGQAGMGCAAALGAPPATAAAAEKMEKANGDFNRLTTMATALLNSVTSS